MRRTLTATVSGGSYSVETTPALGDGNYTAQVEQRDISGNTSQNATNFTIDTTVPIVTFDTTPKLKTRSRNAAFTFHSTGEPTATFRCQLDAGEVRDCPPATYKVKPGSHTFGVQATDAAGNFSNFTTYMWKVKR